MVKNPNPCLVGLGFLSFLFGTKALNLVVKALTLKAQNLFGLNLAQKIMNEVQKRKE